MNSFTSLIASTQELTSASKSEVQSFMDLRKIVKGLLDSTKYTTKDNIDESEIISLCGLDDDIVEQYLEEVEQDEYNDVIGIMDTFKTKLENIGKKIEANIKAKKARALQACYASKYADVLSSFPEEVRGILVGSISPLKAYPKLKNIPNAEEIVSSLDATSLLELDATYKKGDSCENILLSTRSSVKDMELSYSQLVANLSANTELEAATSKDDLWQLVEAGLITEEYATQLMEELVGQDPIVGALVLGAYNNDTHPNLTAIANVALENIRKMIEKSTKKNVSLDSVKKAYDKLDLRQKKDVAMEESKSDDEIDTSVILDAMLPALK